MKFLSQALLPLALCSLLYNSSLFASELSLMAGPGGLSSKLLLTCANPFSGLVDLKVYTYRDRSLTVIETDSKGERIFTKAPEKLGEDGKLISVSLSNWASGYKRQLRLGTYGWEIYAYDGCGGSVTPTTCK